MAQPDDASGIPLGDFLRDLAIAWKSLLAYPAGHPVRRESFARAHGRLDEVLAISAPLVLGVSRDGLIHGQTKIDSGSAQRIAQALHRERVALLIIDVDVRAAELELFLRSLTSERQQADAGPLWDRLLEAGVRGIVLEPVDYHSVVMTDEDAPGGHEGKSIWETITRELLAGRRLSPFDTEQALPAPDSPAELAHWIENLLREAEGPGGGGTTGTAVAGGGSGAASAAGREGNAEGETRGGGAGGSIAVGGATPPAGAALAGPAEGTRTAANGGTAADGDAGLGDAAGRRAAIVTTVSRAVRTHLGRLRGEAREAATREVADLANRLPAGVRTTLFQAALRVLASQDEAAQALRTLVADQPPGDVLAALRHLAAERVQLSPSALRLAQQLTAALRARQGAGAPVDPAVYGAMRELFRDVDVDRIATPSDAAEDRPAIIEMPFVTPFAADEMPDLGPRRDSLADDFVARQLAVTLLDLIAGGLPERAPEEATLWRLEDLYRGFLLAGRIHRATEIVEALRGILQQTRRAGAADGELRRCIERLANREAVGALLEALPQLSPDAAEAARRLIATLGTVAVRHLVAALSEETDRSRRHQLLALLSSLGTAVVPSATLLLADPRWYVVRNMVLLLRSVGDQTSVPQLRRCAEHADLRVRLEAIKSLFAFDSEVPDELLAKAIGDPNPKVAEAAIALVAAYGITQAVPPLVAMLRRLDLFGRRRVVRVRALKTLGRLADPAALPRLEPIFKERFIRLVASEERVAAFAALANYPQDVRQPLVARGLRSRDPAVRAVCERLRAGAVAAMLDETRV